VSISTNQMEYDIDNPFSYGAAVAGASFTGREREIAELYIAMRTGKNAVIHSERRMGRSSILCELARRYAKEFIFVSISLRGVRDEGGFIEMLTKETLRASYANAREFAPAIWELLGSSRLRLAVLESGDIGLVSSSESQTLVISTSENGSGQETKQRKAGAAEIRVCPTCGMPLKWINKYERHYCYSCKKYPPQQRTSKIPLASLSRATPKRLCPECGNDLDFINSFGEYYCQICRKHPLMEYSAKRFQKPSQEDVIEALDLPERIAMQKRKQIIVVLDDFQEIQSFDSFHLLQTLGSRIQQQRNVKYIFSVSKWNVLRKLFEESGAPLCRLAHPIDLRTLPTRELQEFLIRRFKSGGGKLSAEAADNIVSLTEAHPYYAQLLAHELFHLSKSPSIIDTENAMRLAIERHSFAYSLVWESIRSPLQKRYLIGIALEPNMSHGDKFIRRHNLKSRSHIQRIEKQLEARGIISHGQVTDSMFTVWLRSTVHR